LDISQRVIINNISNCYAYQVRVVIADCIKLNGNAAG